MLKKGGDCEERAERGAWGSTRADVLLFTAAFRTSILHAYGFDSVRILCLNR